MTENELLQLIERAAKEDLQELTLWSNRLSSLPPEIGKLTNLQELVLSNNRLSSLPPEIGTLTSLQWLDLSNNQISLPLEIDKLGERELREPVGQDDSHHRNENDRVTFSVFGPQVITPGQNFLLDLWAHLPTQAQMVVLSSENRARRDARCQNGSSRGLWCNLKRAYRNSVAAPLFQTFKRKQPTSRAMSRSEAYRMIRRRAMDAGIFAPVCCHSFRATGITVCLENKGTLETAQNRQFLLGDAGFEGGFPMHIDAIKIRQEDTEYISRGFSSPSK
jgi:Leucine rich repeat